MNSNQKIPDEMMREALFLSLEDMDIEVRLRKLEELLKELDCDQDEEAV